MATGPSEGDGLPSPSRAVAPGGVYIRGGRGELGRVAFALTAYARELPELVGRCAAIGMLSPRGKGVSGRKPDFTTPGLRVEPTSDPWSTRAHGPNACSRYERCHPCAGSRSGGEPVDYPGSAECPTTNSGSRKDRAQAKKRGGAEAPPP